MIERTPATSTAGFTVVEAIAALGLLSLVILGFAVGAEKGIRYNGYSRAVATATTLAHDKVEDLQSLVPGDLELTEGLHADALNPLNATGQTGGLYTRSWEVTDDVPAAGIKTLEVTVTWSMYNQTHTVRVVAVMT